jgi:hypothetical protein
VRPFFPPEFSQVQNVSWFPSLSQKSHSSMKMDELSSSSLGRVCAGEKVRGDNKDVGREGGRLRSKE